MIRKIGIYAPLKNESANTENLLADLITLVEDIRENLHPTNLVVWEVPPLLQNEVMNRKLTQLNDFIHE